MKKFTVGRMDGRIPKGIILFPPFFKAAYKIVNLWLERLHLLTWGRKDRQATALRL